MVVFAPGSILFIKCLFWTDSFLFYSDNSVISFLSDLTPSLTVLGPKKERNSVYTIDRLSVREK